MAVGQEAVLPPMMGARAAPAVPSTPPRPRLSKQPLPGQVLDGSPDGDGFSAGGVGQALIRERPRVAHGALAVPAGEGNQDRFLMPSLEPRDRYKLGALVSPTGDAT